MENALNNIKFVQVFVQFCRIGEIDTMNERYQAEVNIEAKWITNEELNGKYDPNLNWNPKLYIENAFQEPKEIVKYEVNQDITNLNNYIVVEKRNIKGVFWERLELQNFPVDVQELSITCISKLNPNEIKLISDPCKISHIDFKASNTFIDQQKWKLFKHVEMSETASYDSGSTLSLTETPSEMTDIKLSQPLKPSKIVATCFCARKAGYYYFNAYFLIFLITASAMTIFSIDPKLPQNRLQTTCTFLLTSVSFKWVINRSLPTISYLTSLDKYAIICIFFVCLNCAWHAIVGAFWSKEDAKIIDQWVLVAMASLFVLIHFGFMIWLFLAQRKIRILKRKERKFMKKLLENKIDTYPEKKYITRI
ncbi:unnamed protein product [Brachionus calyciflorus]|uniref:Uncharacterized protein n=1 Tax=Brachionus calyciflorus TaxID=104777 RepID=A0A814EWB5_9BILA|nr:unnamed protein product [Brachionus calyciflorus]